MVPPMDPITAAILVGGMVVSSGISAYQADKTAKAQLKAQERAQDKAVKNQNKLVEESFAKRRNALGLGMVGGKTGMAASQTGSVLTSVTDGNQASGL